MEFSVDKLKILPFERAISKTENLFYFSLHLMENYATKRLCQEIQENFKYSFIFQHKALKESLLE